ncbi:MAG: phosphatidylglycerol lysyltransferase domain-containing protein [Thermodesulfobacteriota bacterium]
MNFKPLTVSEFDTIKPFFNEQPYNLSVYSPASLIAWSNRIFTNSYTIIDGALFVAGEAEGHPGDRHLILPLSEGRVYSPEELHRFAGELGFSQYWYAPGDYLESMDRSEVESFFIPEEQPEFADYVYLTEDLARLKGNRFSKKRNLIHQFFREYIRKNRVAVEAIHEENARECLEFLEIWCEEYDCDVDKDTSLSCEKEALTTTLHHIDRFASRGISVRVDGVISALGIGSRLNRTTATLNFEKAFSKIKGLYQFLDNECAKRLFEGFRYVNKESDMNLPNLAETKRSYNPIWRVKSFALSLR